MVTSKIAIKIYAEIDSLLGEAQEIIEKATKNKRTHDSSLYYGDADEINNKIVEARSWITAIKEDYIEN